MVFGLIQIYANQWYILLDDRAATRNDKDFDDLGLLVTIPTEIGTGARHARPFGHRHDGMLRRFSVGVWPR